MTLEPLTTTEPRSVGPHRLLGRLGQGGMGTVYLALTPDDRAVAVKVLRDGPSDAEGRRRFRRELDALQRVRGPHLVEVLGGDAEAATPWLVTRFVPGTRLDEVVARDGALTPAALVRVALGTARALQALHAAGVVHRDLTPGNVLLVDGEPHVIDLGLAVVADVTALTRSGLVVGTAGYLAPEQVLGAPCGPPADVHAWGATLALAATGRPPYGTGRPEAVLYRVVHGEPDLVGVPEELAGLVARAMHREPAARPPVHELVAALERLAARDLVGVGSGPHAVPAGLREAPDASVRAVDLPDVLGAELTRVLGRDVTEPLRLSADPTAVLRREATQRLPLLDDGRTRAGGPPAGSVPLRPEPEVAEHDRAPAGDVPGRGPVLAVCGLALLGALALLAPVLTATGAVLGLLLLQTATRGAAGRRLRVERRGPRRRDALLSVVTAPWQALGATVDLLLGLPLLLLGAGVPALVAAATWPGQTGPAAGAATAIVLGAVLTLARRRWRASRSALSRAGAGVAPRGRDVAVTGALLLAGAGLVGVFAASGPHWWPAQQPPQVCLPLLTCS